MVFGEETLFLLEDPSECQGFSDFILRFLGNDEHGMKMKGTFPKKWTKQGNQVIGPLLYDEENCFLVNNFNYQEKLLWITKTLPAVSNK